ncbi:MAG: hypothetical protein HZB68_00460 [Candidatus Aenigmarchaeota archaeon]|nr:hypothetical protein [Candidatus Aenigmarchaeota archaeon]
MAPAITVTKRDGTEQKFSQSKIKQAVSKTAKRVGMPKELATYIQNNLPKEIQHELRGKKEVDSSEIRDLVLSNLKEKSELMQEIVREFRGHKK